MVRRAGRRARRAGAWPTPPAACSPACQLFPWYGTQLGVDGGLRIALVAAARAHRRHLTRRGSAPVLVIAPLAGVLLTLRRCCARRRRRAGRLGALLRGSACSPSSSLLSQVVVELGVINVRLLDPSTSSHRRRAAARALVLVRIPLFVFASLQASLLPGAGHLGHHRRPRRLPAACCAGRSASSPRSASLGGARSRSRSARGWWAPSSTPPTLLGHGDFAWLAVGTLGLPVGAWCSARRCSPSTGTAPRPSPGPVGWPPWSP